MHRNVYQAVQPPSFLAILIRNMSILQQNLPKLRYFVRRASKPPLIRYGIIITRTMNCLPFLMSKKWEAVQTEALF